MKELLVLVTGFVVGIKLWLAAYEFVSLRSKSDLQIGFRALARVGVALTLGILAYAVATVPSVDVNARALFYLASTSLVLIGGVGEIVTFDWNKERKGKKDVE